MVNAQTLAAMTAMHHAADFYDLLPLGSIKPFLPGIWRWVLPRAASNVSLAPRSL